MRKIWVLMVLVSYLCLNSLSIAQATQNLVLDGSRVNLSTVPMSEKGRILVPLRAICEAIGASVVWNEEVQGATVTKGDTVIKMKIGSGEFNINGEEKISDVAVYLENGKILVPLRFFMEAFGGTIQWNPDSELIFIASSKAETGIGENCDNPVPFGQSYITTGGFEIQVERVIQGPSAWSIVKENRISPEPLPSDMKYVIIIYSVKDVSSPITPINSGFFSSLTGSSKVIYNISDAVIYLPMANSYREFTMGKSPDEPATATSVFYVAINESDMRLIICDCVTLDKIYFEIR